MAEEPTAADSLLSKGSKGQIIALRDGREIANVNNALCTIKGVIEDIQSVRHPTSFVETLIHVLKGNIGSGMFSMGEAFKNGGLLLSPVVTVFLGVICIYNNHVLLRAADFIKKKFALKHNPSFSETVELCFQAGPDSFKKMSDYVRVIVKLFVILTQLGFCCVYICIVSATLKEIISYSFQYDLSQKLYMAAIFPPILVTSLITSLKFLAPVSFGSNICVFGAVFLTLFVAIRDGGSASISDRAAIGSIETFPLFVGKVIYSFEGIGLILPLRNEMKKPEEFGGGFGVLNIGMSIICTLLVVVGFIGYLSYGDDVQSSLSLNIRKDDIIGMTVQVIMCLGLLFSYPLQFYVAADIIWDDINCSYGPFKSWKLYKLMSRTIIVIMTFAVALVIPDVGLFISLIGSVCATALALVFPALLEAALNKHQPTTTLAAILAVLTMCLATFSFITGTYSSVSEMVKAFSPQVMQTVQNSTSS